VRRTRAGRKYRIFKLIVRCANANATANRGTLLLFRCRLYHFGYCWQHFTNRLQLTRPPRPPEASMFRAAAAVIGLSPLLSAALALPPADVPVTGKGAPATAPFDRLMTSFVEEHDLPGGALAVARDGKLVYARGFGYADRDKKEAVAPD